MRLRSRLAVTAAFTSTALLLAACEVNVESSRGANSPPPAYRNGGGGTVVQNGTSAPPAYGNGGGGGGATTAPPATPATPATPVTATPANPPPTATTGPTVAPPPTTTGVGGGVVMPASSGVGLPFQRASVGAGGRLAPFVILPAPAPTGPGTRGGDMATPIGRLPLVSGDVDFGTNVQYPDSFKGMVYLLPPGTTSMPAYDAMKAQLALYTRTFEVEPQNFKGLGAPGASPRAQDFGIRYEGFFTTRTAGTYQITVANEDGARLYVDNKLVVDNDGVHPVTYKAGNVDLAVGNHSLRIDYFKAAANPEVCLEVWVHTPSMNANTVMMFAPAL